ncbi:hypothetical protein DRY87_26660, partial [Salmonella enterica subsp. enterica serovar Newport]|nr:hypothetical protein [Salmonella enterica subsp. enterica serovar Newport]
MGDGSVLVRLTGRRDSAPLCPVGHLPHKGGDQPAPLISPIPSSGAKVHEWSAKAPRVISPLEGEMSDRTEGGGRVRGAVSL